jgi:hypothetical protein
MDDVCPQLVANARTETDPWALRLAKRAVNHTLDTMGFSTAIASCFDMHHLGHTRALYRRYPRMAHAVFEIEPRVRRVLTAMLKGTLGE